MSEEGIPYAILTNGLVRVLLHVLYDDPGTLSYHLCGPNRKIYEGGCPSNMSVTMELWLGTP